MRRSLPFSTDDHPNYDTLAERDHEREPRRTVPLCPRCSRPTHASESNDDGVCRDCLGDAAIVECPSCGGSGVIVTDRVRGNEHYTDEEPCLACSEPAFDDRDADEIAAVRS